MITSLAAAVETVRSRGAHGRLPPGPPAPAAVQTALWIRTPISFIRRARARYGETFTMRLVGMPPFVSLSTPDAIKAVFTGPSDDLHAGEANAVLEPILGEHSVLLLDGPRHMRQRRLLLPPFHGQRMRQYGETMRDLTLASMATWPRGEVFSVHAHTQAITLDVILRTVFGMEDGAALTQLRARLSELLEGVSNPLLLVPAFRVDLGPRTPGGRLRRCLEEVDRILFAQIRERRAEGRSDREDVLSMLVEATDENGERMLEQELRDELMTLLLAGHETTATSLAWTLHRLIRHPEALARLQAELDEAFPDGEIDPDAVRELKWLDAVIKETLRLNPVVPLVGRGLQRPMELGGVAQPADVVAVPNIYLTHRNPDIWPEPDRFDPTRFLDAKPSPYTFFPFGGGVRRCIGMAFALYEMQVVLATVLRHLTPEAAPGVDIRLVRRSVTFAPSDGMPVIIRPR